MSSKKNAAYYDGGFTVQKVCVGVTVVQSLASNEVLITPIKSNCGLLLVRDITNSRTGILRLDGTTITYLSQNAIYSLTKDTASKLNVYFETDQIKVQNKTASPVNLRVSLLGI
ncbi:MAG: hypothetical protein A2167_08665 [Planctomycetes bacterium RBG_13_46_10]|nr:MAG: hypothetical protein A2167_08665 [Planctomycetes bacterium RBG_13_46_10]